MKSGVMVRCAVLVWAASLAAAGCGAASTGTEPSGTTAQETASTSPPISTSPPTPTQGNGGDFGMQAQLKGTLRGDPERRCMWVGDAESDVSILWPPHVTIKRDPLRLVDTRSDETIARAGDAVRIGGGSSALPPPEKPACRVSRWVFIAHQVERE